MSTKRHVNEFDEQVRKEALEHGNMLLALRAILATEHGRTFFKYLFKTFQVNELPAQGVDGMMLHDTLGYLRSGRAIFKIAAEANAIVAAELLAQNEKEAYDELMAQNRNG